MAVQQVDGSLEALAERLARLEQLLGELASRQIVVHVHTPARGVGCEREAILRLLARLEADIPKAMRDCPVQCKEKAINALLLYELELKELLREEPVFGK